METDFTKLNPLLSTTGIDMLGSSELGFNCPHCKHRILLRVNFNGPPKGDSIWGLTVESGKGWETATITPSVSNHTVGRKSSTCHFSVINGKIHP